MATRREVIIGAASAAAGIAVGALPTATASEPLSLESTAEAQMQYGYTLNVHGGDHDALQAALVHYQQFCELMVAHGHTRPFASNRLVMSNLLSQTSALNAEAVEEFCEAWPAREQRRTSMLGHASLNTTQRYLEPSSDAKRRLVDLV